MADALLDTISAYVDEVWEDVVQDIAELVAIESVEDAANAAPGAPFGPGPKAALDKALEIAEKLGLTPHNLDGYIGYGELKGEKESYLASIAHADIVPIGPNWTFDPLKLTRKDGYLIGRGTADDKGPLVCSLYVMAYFARKVKESGKKLPLSLRAIIGANEETYMHDVDYYLEHEAEPRFAFSPDAWFPAIVGEKGNYSGYFTSAELPEARTIVEFWGGTAVNAIPSLAYARLRKGEAKLPEEAWLSIQDEGDFVLLTAKGKGGHAAFPEGTLSAFKLLEDYLLENKLYSTKEEEDFLRLASALCAHHDGAALGIASKNEKFGALTAISGVLKTVENHFVQSIDSRYPDSTTAEEITERLTEFAAGFGASYGDVHFKVPFYIDPASPEIQCMLGALKDVTGMDEEPVVIGGGTYARKFTCAVSAGPYLPNSEEIKPKWVGAEHGPDEGASEEELKNGMKVYILALERLLSLDLD